MAESRTRHNEIWGGGYIGVLLYRLSVFLGERSSEEGEEEEEEEEEEEKEEDEEAAVVVVVVVVVVM